MNSTIHRILTIVGAWPSIMDWMHFLNSYDVVAVLGVILPVQDATHLLKWAIFPFWIENTIMVNMGVKIGYVLGYDYRKSINCLNFQLRV